MVKRSPSAQISCAAEIVYISCYLLVMFIFLDLEMNELINTDM